MKYEKLGDKKYCADCRTLLVWSDLQQTWCCRQCGECLEQPVIRDDEEEENREPDIWIQPLMQPRSQRSREQQFRRQFAFYDDVTESLLSKGYTIKDTMEQVDDKGTFSYSNNTTNTRKRFF